MAIFVPNVTLVERVFVLLFGALVTAVVFYINSSPAHKKEYSEFRFNTKLSRSVIASFTIAFVFSGLILPVIMLLINEAMASDFIGSTYWYLMVAGLTVLCFPLVWVKID